MQASVNSFLVREKQLKARLADLNQLKQQATSRTRYYTEAVETRRDEPTYDIKQLDKMAIDIQNALFAIENAIKESNAVTKITVDVNVEDLMKPIV